MPPLPALQLRVLSPALGAEVAGLDLREELSDATVRALRTAWLRHGVLLLRGQRLDPVSLVAFTRRFGEPVVYTRSENACAGHPEVLVLSNAKVEGKPIGAAISGRYWHTDGHFLECPPAGTVLFGKEVPPERGDTVFVNMAAAYAALPDDLRDAIDGRGFVMDRVQSLAYHYPERPTPGPGQKLLWPDRVQPLVRTHPETGARSLYIGGIVPWRIVGMEAGDSDALMARLHAHAFQPRFRFRHRWQPGDLVMWDNRCTAHKATGYDMQRHTRTMLRTTIAGDAPFYAAAAGSAAASAS
ncbi:MAG: TauD/TfdA family dioxygenase [Pseudomonadota bacterium]